MKKATLCFYRFIPCFLHEDSDEDYQLIGMDWYIDTLLSAVIWLDVNVFKINNLPIKFTNLVLEL